MYRKFYLFSAVVIIFLNNSFGQLSGSYTIPGQSFPTIKKAADSLNAVGIGTGGVTFNVSAGYTENVTDPITITATGTASKIITFQKSGGGANPLITRTDAGTLATSIIGGAGDAIIRIEGTDYITFNGINLAAIDQGIEYGYLTHKPSGTNGCQHVTITNCQITLTKGVNAFVAGIYIGNGTTSVSSNTGVTVTASTGINSNILLNGNTIQNVHSGILFIGSAAAGFYDSDMIIGQSGAGNTFQNFGGGAADTSYGVYFKYVNNPSVTFNTINNAGGGGSPHIYNLFGVYFSIVSGDIVVSNNAFTINNSSTRTSSFIHNNNNTVITETYNNNTFSGTLNTGTLNLIYTFSNNTPDKTVSGNVITAITKSGGAVNGYYSATSFVTGGTETITNNNFSNITLSSAGSVSPIYCSGTTTHNLVITNNVISNITGFGTVYAINAIGVNNNTINNNTIFNISTNSSIYGIYFSGLNAAVYRNNVYGLSSSSTGFNVVYGIVTQSINNNTTNLNIYNNFISDLKAPGSQSAVGTSGISAISGSNVNIFYNSVYLKFTSTFAGNTSAALVLGDTSPNSLDIRDNIFVNAVDVTTGLRAAAINKSGTWLLNISDNTNNNLYYAGVPSSKHLIFFDGTNSDSTLVQYKNRLSPRESNSVTENPPFVNSVTPPYNLHMNTTVPTQVESKGTPINSPIVITTDYDGNTRNAATPDLGADEFAGITADLAPPIILYSPLLNTSSTSQRTLTASVTDPGSGVPTTPPGWPNLYWKKNTGGTWTAATPSGVSGGVYTFNFGSGAVLNDTVYYYIVAQDNASPPNVGAYPSIGAGGFTYNPPAASIPPTTPNSYIITHVPLSGNYTVGVAGNYQTITAAIKDLNLRGVSAAVNFLLIDDAYSINETFPLQISISNVSKPTAVNKVTIKPNTGKLPFIQGGAAGSAILKIMESYVNIDGSNSGGTDRSLTIQNTSSNFPSGVLFGSRGSAPITGGSLKNCKVISGASYSSPNYGIIISDAENLGIPGFFNNITIQNNQIQKSFNGIYCTSEISAGNGSGLLITGNSLNSASTNAIHELGIYLEGVDGAVVSNNSIGNLGGNDAGSVTGIWIGAGTKNSSISNNLIGPIPENGGNGTPRGIVVTSGITNSNITISGNELFNFSTSYGGAMTALYVYSATTGVLIEKNKIHDISNDNNFGFGARGIIINTNVPASNIMIKNNFVWNIKATAKESPNTWGVGIGIDGSTGGVNVYHNSVNFYGSFAGGATSGVNAAFSLLTPDVTAVDVRDNIFVNKLDNTGSITDKSYSINSQAPNSAFSHINYNDYYAQGPSGVLGYLGSDQTTLPAWRTATGQDANSISVSAGFISNTDLHISPDSGFVSNKGFYLASVSNDIDGDVRNNPPDIGADEYTAVISNTFQLSVNVTNGWNMVSIPGLNSPDQNVNTWWPFRDLSANVFKYAAGYQSVTTAVPGTGYWMKHAGARTYNTGDEWPAGGIQTVPHNTIAATAGWNLIGGYELSVSTANITTIPAGLQSGPVYKYSGGYQVAATLDPGYGYWIKLIGAGQIVIPETLEKGSGEGEYIAEDWGRITITDANGKNSTLYAVRGGSDVDLNKYELPPVPPAGMFDVRFSSGRIAEDLSTAQTIDLNGVIYPLTIKADGVGIRVIDETGRRMNASVKAGGMVTISDETIQKLTITGELLPSVYALEQNYPNPFNPSTVIKFSLPENSSNVKLSIYNALGEKVAELVNTSLAAGKYSYTWNAKNMATGMYIYELRTDKFVSVKKMILLK